MYTCMHYLHTYTHKGPSLKHLSSVEGLSRSVLARASALEHKFLDLVLGYRSIHCRAQESSRLLHIGKHNSSSKSSQEC